MKIWSVRHTLSGTPVIGVGVTHGRLWLIVAFHRMDAESDWLSWRDNRYIWIERRKNESLARDPGLRATKYDFRILWFHVAVAVSKGNIKMTDGR